jgi:hypothetical protein
MLRNQQVKISYGLPAIPLAAGDEYQRLFPYLGSPLGGCLQSPSSPKYKIVRYCPDCREAFKHWAGIEIK